MKTKTLIITVVVIIFILIAVLATAYLKPYYDYNQDKKKAYDKTKTYPSVLDFKEITISEINNKNLTGNFNVEAFVIQKFVCAPCSPYMFCKICKPDGILISENLIQKGDYIQLNKERIKLLDLETTNPNQFEIGQKYKFSIEIIEKEKVYSDKERIVLKLIRLLGYEKLI
ncbi:MAG TPA: hypothetical protein VJG30_03950 [Candidatus Nanoarchaeia archaeon]|nr:hypothetical protein [Candidatus Nanoarchaeia archaeon]